MLYGMDISKHQQGINLTKGKYDFCIIKATEGYGYTDPMFEEYAEQLTRMDKLIGCYHFARPDLHGDKEGMEKEARWFIGEVERANLFGKAILVLDWETEPMDREDLIDAFITRVIDMTDIKPFIYGSAFKLSKWEYYNVLQKCLIWKAKWPSLIRYDVGVSPDIELTSGVWDIWQYSATGKYPGFKGNVDLDMSILTEDEWKKAASPVAAKETIREDMQWAIDNGLFIGDSSQLYRPTSPLTREEAAIVLHRFYDKFIKEE